MASTKPRTIFQLYGRLTKDPEAYTTKAGKLQVEFVVAHNTGKNYKACFIEFVTGKQPVAEYLLENFRKGDEIFVNESTPIANPRAKPNMPHYKFMCWDVALKQPKPVEGSVKESIDDDGKHNSDDEAPF